MYQTRICNRIFWCNILFVVFILQQQLALNVAAGPTKREIYPEIESDPDTNQTTQVCIVGDVIYGADEPIIAEQPCLKCRCQPPNVQCETIKCFKTPGCKAIHKPNICCPEYQCECHHEGKTYANGERLKTSPGNECKVCYCRGGEVQCAEVSCYYRKDCEAKTVPGQCCPKYDHCPPKEPYTPNYITNQTLPIYVNKEFYDFWTNYTTDNLNQIIETTQNIETTTPLTTTTTTTTKTKETKAKIKSPQKGISTIPVKGNKNHEGKITIQEIIPEIKEIPIIAPIKTEQIKPEGELIIEEAKSNDLNGDTEPESSEITEVFQQPPPVLRIGDKLLFLKKDELVPEKSISTPLSVITIFGAEGLQRGYEEVFNEDKKETKHVSSLVKKEAPKDVIITTTTTITTDFNNSNENITENYSTEMIKTTEIIEQNPAYPPISEILTLDNYDDNSTKILDYRNNNVSWIKNSSNFEEFPDEMNITTTDITTININALNVSDNDTYDNFEIIDMLNGTLMMDEVEVFTVNSTTMKIETTTDPMMIDVETFPPENKKSILKRENQAKDENDQVFKELDIELNVENTESTLTVKEEEEQADKIFKELLEETSTKTPPLPKEGRTRESETLQRVSEALAKFTLKGRKNSLDSNILSILSNFFSSQYKYYSDNK